MALIPKTQRDGQVPHGAVLDANGGDRARKSSRCLQTDLRMSHQSPGKTLTQFEEWLLLHNWPISLINQDDTFSSAQIGELMH